MDGNKFQAYCAKDKNFTANKKQRVLFMIQNRKRCAVFLLKIELQKRKAIKMHEKYGILRWFGAYIP